MGIMLVYDITNQKSLNNVTNWLRNIDEHASDDVVRVLVGNKVAALRSNRTKGTKDTTDTTELGMNMTI